MVGDGEAACDVGGLESRVRRHQGWYQKSGADSKNQNAQDASWIALSNVGSRLLGASHM